jgi:hypothetical protein
MRLALLYALLDQSDVIDVVHLDAGLALWNYSERSARYLYGDSLGDKLADRLLALLRSRGRRGMSRTEIRKAMGNREGAADRRDRALNLLARHHLVHSESRSTGGKPEVRWYATT